MKDTRSRTVRLSICLLFVTMSTVVDQPTQQKYLEFLTKATSIRAVERQKETYLHRAIIRQEFILHHQPKVAAAVFRDSDGLKRALAGRIK